MKGLLLEITLQEPMLVSAPGGDPNTNLSLSYIPGSAIRGALANRYLASIDSPVAQEPFQSWFLSGAIKFLNAYPCLEIIENGEKKQVRALPVPEALVQDKTRNAVIVNRIGGGLAQAPKSVGASFGWIQHDTITTVDQKEEVILHTTRDRQMGKAGDPEQGQEGAVFQYKALARGSVFLGLILVPEEWDQAFEILQKLLQEGDFCLGGSISAGYGLVQIKVEEEFDFWEFPLSLAETISAGETFSVVFLSDAVLKSDAGQNGDHLVEVLNRCLGNGTVSQLAAYRKLGWVGGFDRKWGLPVMQEYAVKAGASFLLKAERPISCANLQALQAEGIGERLAEGFGRIAFQWNIPAEIKRERAQQVQQKPTARNPLGGQNQTLAKSMVERWLRKKLDRAVAAAVNRLMSTVNPESLPSTSQLGRLRLQCRASARAGRMAPLVEYLEGGMDRRAMREQLQRLWIANQSLYRWIAGWARSAEEPQADFDIWQTLQVNSVKAYAVGDDLAGLKWQQEPTLRREYIIRLIDGVVARLMNEKELEQ